MSATNTSSPSTEDLARSNALIVGVGALGCAAAHALATFGVGRLTLVDDDRVEIGNLHRQILYDEASLGSHKVDVAARALARSALGCTVTPKIARLDGANADLEVAGHDVVVDATDDPDTKYLLNAAAIRRGTPLVYGGVARTGGMAMLVDPAISACLACAFPAEPAVVDGGCDRLGILAPVAGLVGTLQAHLVLRALGGARGAGGTLFVYDVREPHWREIRFSRRPSCAACAEAAPRAA